MKFLGKSLRFLGLMGPEISQNEVFQILSKSNAYNFPILSHEVTVT